MPVRLSEPSRNKTVPLDKGERARACAGRESLKNPMHCSLAEGLPQISVGQRPTSRGSKQTLSEGLHEPSAGQRPASRVPAALLSSFPKNPSRTVPRLKALQITARGVAPCSHATRTDMPVRLSEPRRKITVPLDKGERARKLCTAKRRGKGVAAAALLSRKKIRFNPFPSVQSVFKSPRPPRLRVRILSGELPLFLPFLNLPFPSLTILLILSLRALRVSA